MQIGLMTPTEEDRYQDTYSASAVESYPGVQENNRPLRPRHVKPNIWLPVIVQKKPYG